MFQDRPREQRMYLPQSAGSGIRRSTTASVHHAGLGGVVVEGAVEVSGRCVGVECGPFVDVTSGVAVDTSAALGDGTSGDEVVASDWVVG